MEDIDFTLGISLCSEKREAQIYFGSSRQATNSHGNHTRHQCDQNLTTYPEASHEIIQHPDITSTKVSVSQILQDQARNSTGDWLRKPYCHGWKTQDCTLRFSLCSKLKDKRETDSAKKGLEAPASQKIHMGIAADTNVAKTSQHVPKQSLSVDNGVSATCPDLWAAKC